MKFTAAVCGGAAELGGVRLQKATVIRLLSKRWFRLSAGFILVLLAVTMASAWYYRVWSLRDLRAYQGMSEECHPVWRELHWGHIRAGQDVEEVIASTNPERVERYGEYVRLSYQKRMSFTSVTIMAKNGRLACAAAGSCTWGRVFFDELTPADWKAYGDEYEAHWQPIRRERDKARAEDLINTSRKRPLTDDEIDEAFLMLRWDLTFARVSALAALEVEAGHSPDRKERVIARLTEFQQTADPAIRESVGQVLDRLQADK